MFEPRKAEMWSTLGMVTNEPPVDPLEVRIRSWAERTRSASRTVARLTPNCAASAASLGRRSAGEISPVMISSRIWSATCS